jgi:hypothetical protein
MPDQGLRFKCTAHHEAGHIAIAAAQGLKLRPEGFAMDTLGEGLACCCKHPDNSDESRERIIVTSFAGYKAQQRFCQKHFYSDPDAETVIGSCDWREACTLITSLSSQYPGTVHVIQSKLEDCSTQFVERNWPAIEALAATLLEKTWEQVRPLKSGAMWSTQMVAKYVDGAEAISILRGFGIEAGCDADC